MLAKRELLQRSSSTGCRAARLCWEAVRGCSEAALPSQEQLSPQQVDTDLLPAIWLIQCILCTNTACALAVLFNGLGKIVGKNAQQLFQYALWRFLLIGVTIPSRYVRDNTISPMLPCVWAACRLDSPTATDAVP